MPLRAILIPADPAEPIAELDVLTHPLGASDGPSYERVLTVLQALVGGYVEIVRTFELQALNHNDSLHNVVMVVNENGHSQHLATNSRAWAFYPRTSPIVGDVVLIGEDRSDPYEGYALEELYAHVTPQLVAQKITEIQS